MLGDRLDFLQELGNIGAGHATTALSRMLDGQRLELHVPEARLFSFQEAVEFIGGPEQNVVGIYIRISGDVQGHMAFLLPVHSAQNLIKMLTQGQTAEFDELGLSALQEVGNIMITSYLNALGSMTGLVMAPSIPGIAVDMAGAIWSSILADALVVDDVTLIKTRFRTAEEEIEGHITFLPDEQDFSKILRALGLEESI